MIEFFYFLLDFGDLLLHEALVAILNDAILDKVFHPQMP